MKNKILNVEGITILKKEAQKTINAGSFGGGGVGLLCQPQIIECRTDWDCPCNKRCGIQSGDFFIEGVCAF